MRALKKFKSIKSLEQVLISLEILKPDEFMQATLKAEATHQSLLKVLQDDKKITDEQAALVLATQAEVDYIDLSQVSPTPEAWSTFPDSAWREFLAVPLKLVNEELEVAVPDPFNFGMLESLQKVSSRKLIVKVASPQGIRKLIQRYSEEQKKIKKASGKFKSDADSPKMGEAVASEKQPADLSRVQYQESEDAQSTSKIVDQIINESIKHKASDIHIEPDSELLRVRIRVDGVLHALTSFKPDLHAPLISRIKVLAHMDIAEKRVSQDGSFRFQKESGYIDLRVSTLPTVRGEKAVLRILDKSNLRLEIEKLCLRDEDLQRVRSVLERPHGIVLVAGPTGSGKTTTVYSMLNHVNSIERNIITVEDPVEYQFGIINQIQVNTRAGVAFANVLRNILRQDPDIVMVGEIRDRETAEVAIRAALTGHLVISTIHTNDSPSTIVRLLDMGIEHYLLSSALSCILSQRLIRTLCIQCKKPAFPTQEEILGLQSPELTATTPVYQSIGCDTCFGTGFLGRVPIFELLIPSMDLQKAIALKKSLEEIQDILAKEHFISLRRDGIRKILSGITTANEVLKATV